jgi:hypothetical protein
VGSRVEAVEVGVHEIAQLPLDDGKPSAADGSTERAAASATEIRAAYHRR